MSRLSLTSEGRSYIRRTWAGPEDSPTPWEGEDQALEWFLLAMLHEGKVVDTENVHRMVYRKDTGSYLDPGPIRRAIASLYEAGLVDFKED